MAALRVGARLWLAYINLTAAYLTAAGQLNLAAGRKVVQ
jgi:hypothetical protein